MIVGLTLTKLSVERHSPIKGKVGVQHNIDIKDVKEQSVTALQGSQKVLAFSFSFTVSYTPHIADIALTGDVLYALDAAKAQEVLISWEKKKKVSSDVSLEVLNVVLQKCTISALTLSQEFNLPPHLPMPKVNFQQPSPSAYIG